MDSSSQVRCRHTWLVPRCFFYSNLCLPCQAEMSIESTERGPEVAIQCAWLISGIAVAYWIDFGFTRLDSQISWVSSDPCVANPKFHFR